MSFCLKMLLYKALLLLLLLSASVIHATIPYCGKRPLPPSKIFSSKEDALALPSSALRKSAWNVVSEISADEDEFSIPPPPSADQGYELAQVFAFMRHGDRNVHAKNICWNSEAEELQKCRNLDISLPSSRAQAKKFFEKLRGEVEGTEKCAIGQLTTYGFRQHLRNGKILRKAYNGFISEHFEHSELHARSTDYSRTISSLQAVLVGLYDSDSLLMHFDHLLDIAVENATHGIIQPNSNMFPVLTTYANDALDGKSENPVSKKVYSELMEAFSHLSDLVGKPLSFKSSEQLFDCLNVNFCNNRTIPYDQEIVVFLNKIAPWKYQIMLNNPSPVENGRYAVGPLLAATRKELLGRITNSKQVKKFYLVMGHDTGPMMPLLSALQIWDGRWPSYASKIVLELYENKTSGSFAVRTIYDGKQILVPGCSSTLCDWTEFDRILQELLPPEHDKFELVTL